MVEIMQNRNFKGQFVNKSDGNRQVRSIRVTDEIWEKFGNIASERSITRADLLEEIVKSNSLSSSTNQSIIILQEALKLKANAGGAIKEKIREALLILSK